MGFPRAGSNPADCGAFLSSRCFVGVVQCGAYPDVNFPILVHHVLTLKPFLALMFQVVMVSDSEDKIESNYIYADER